MLTYVTILFTVVHFARCKTYHGIGFELLYSSNKISVKDEIVNFENELPKWIKGILMRNGPAVFEEGQSSFLHILDGFSKITKINFVGNNSACFATDVLQTISFTKSEQRGKIMPYLLFGDVTPPFTAYERINALINEVDNTNINIFKFPSDEINRNHWDYVAMSDYWHVYQFDENNLGPAKKISPVVPDSGLFSNWMPLISSAHPVKEYNSDTYLNFVSIIRPIGKSSLKLVRIHSTSKREEIVTIYPPRIAYMHSFGLSENYAILFTDPYFVDLYKALETAQLLRSLTWEPEAGTTVYVVNIKTKDIIKFKIEAAFRLHQINSFEENGKIFVDYVEYPNINFLKSMKISSLKNATLRNKIATDAKLVRYEIDLVKHLIIKRVIKESEHKFVNHLDFPAISEMFRFKNYCYVYGVSVKTDTEFSEMAIVKKDICHNQDVIWQKLNHYPSEAIFVANPNGNSEDDGVLLSIVLDGRAKQSYVLVLNASDLSEISKAYLPVVVPMSVHGHFFT